jgi:hypothetical protein
MDLESRLSCWLSLIFFISFFVSWVCYPCPPSSCTLFFSCTVGSFFNKSL